MRKSRMKENRTDQLRGWIGIRLRLILTSRQQENKRHVHESSKNEKNVFQRCLRGTSWEGNRISEAPRIEKCVCSISSISRKAHQSKNSHVLYICTQARWSAGAGCHRTTSTHNSALTRPIPGSLALAIMPGCITRTTIATLVERFDIESYSDFSAK